MEGQKKERNYGRQKLGKEKSIEIATVTGLTSLMKSNAWGGGVRQCW